VLLHFRHQLLEGFGTNQPAVFSEVQQQKQAPPAWSAFETVPTVLLQFFPLMIQSAASVQNLYSLSEDFMNTPTTGQ